MFSVDAMSNKCRRPLSDVAHYTRHLNRADDTCHSRRHAFVDDVTFIIFV